MTSSEKQKARVSRLERECDEEQREVPTIITQIIAPDKSCSRVLVQSGPFAGCEFNRSDYETTAQFLERAGRELEAMKAEIENGKR